MRSAFGSRRLFLTLPAALALLLAFTAFASAASPTIEGESASHLTPTDATLEAEVDPQGAPSGAFYQFQLLLDPGEAPTEIACPASPPSGFSVCVGPQDLGALPLGFISGGEPRAVSLDLAGAGITLTPGRTYFFRVLAADRIFTEDTAEWEAPAVVGASQSFTTPEPIKGPPPLDEHGQACPFSTDGCGGGPPNLPGQRCRKGQHRHHGRCVKADRRHRHRKHHR